MASVKASDEDPRRGWTAAKAIDGRAWVDPEVERLAGISAEELGRDRSPATFDPQRGGVAQPPFDPAKPYMRGYPEQVYKAIVAMPHEVVATQASETEPPVVVED